jgi:hypothetical protein
MYGTNLEDFVVGVEGEGGGECVDVVNERGPAWARWEGQLGHYSVG